MRWPFVSRAAYESMVGQCEAWIKYADAERARNDTLLEKYHALKLQGAASEPNSGAIVPTPPREPSALSQVIREQAMGPDGRMDTNLAAHLRSYAAQLKREKKTEAEILEAIRDGWRSTEQDYQTV